jgi:hypothetical protein
MHKGLLAKDNDQLVDVCDIAQNAQTEPYSMADCMFLVTHNFGVGSGVVCLCLLEQHKLGGCLHKNRYWINWVTRLREGQG